MRVNYYSTIPPPVFPGTEAMMKEIDLLMSEFEGSFLNLYPFSHYIPGFPKVFTGMNHIRQLRMMDRDADIHHVFLHHLFPLPALRVLKKPVVCSVMTTASPFPGLLSRYPHYVVINTQRDAAYLKARGFNTYRVIIPGIDTSAVEESRIDYHSGEEFVLFCGSAPWTPGHFRQKGFDMLLSLASEMPDIRLVCLWRGVLYDEFIERIEHFALQDQVEVINRKVDINPILARIHAGIVLAESPGVAAAYPRSLLESLAAGRPVISSGCMAISEYIKEHSCGCMVESFSISDLAGCIKTAMENYSALAENARKIDTREFSTEKMVESYRDLYYSRIRH